MVKEELPIRTQPQPLMSLLRSYTPELFALDTKPLLDTTFSFPWKEFGDALSKLFNIEITLSLQEQKWRDEKDLYEGLVQKVLPLSISLAHLNGECSLCISRSDIELLMKESLQISLEQQLKEDSAFFDQFWLFCSLELCAAAQGIEPLSSLSPRLASSSPLKDAAYFSLDIQLTIAKQVSVCRLFLSSEFLKSWKTLRPVPAKESLVQNVTLPIAIEAGRGFLLPHELASFQPGDIFFITYPFLIPGSDKSRVYLTHRGKPLFRAKLKEEGIKILEMPVQHEAFIPLGGMSMANQEPLPEHSEFPEEPSDQPPAPALPAEEDISQEEKETTEEEQLPPLTEEEVVKMSKQATLVTKKPLKLHDIPLSVVVQLAEITMTMGELAALQPGNLLDLHMRPENGVSLVINGRVVAQGELILVGENVGVRIQEIELEQ